jgi:hypothetical protein
MFISSLERRRLSVCNNFAVAFKTSTFKTRFIGKTYLRLSLKTKFSLQTPPVADVYSRVTNASCTL